MTMRPGQHDDELISASLTGDLSEAEQAELDRHLAECARCRDTLAAFSEERRLISGMRHVSAPRDLGARVRAGIERGSRGSLPWWRRPAAVLTGTAVLGTVATALLAVVVLTNLRNPQVATGSPTQSSTASISSQVPSASVEPSAGPTTDETPAPLASIDPNPVGTLRYTFDQQQPKLEVTTDAGVEEIRVTQDGLPIDAVLSPDGMWIAFRVMGDGSGLIDTYAYSLADGGLITLTQGNLDSPFARLAWSGDSSMLAYTVIGRDGSADVWIFDAQADVPAARRLTDDGAAFAADFQPGQELWISRAGVDPVTFMVPVPQSGGADAPVDLEAASLETHAGTFLPMLSPRATPASMVVWRGEMALDDGGWHFARGGMLYLATPGRKGEQQLFGTLQIPPGGEAFRSARFAWAPDGDGFAVWDAMWTGIQQPEGFPDEGRVYFGHLKGNKLIGPDQALDVADTEGKRIVHVALAGGQYLALTVITAEGSEGGSYAPTTELRLITRHTGDQADDIQTFGQNRVWTGPAFYPAELDS
jgi:hypothetical protein